MGLFNRSYMRGPRPFAPADDGTGMIWTLIIINAIFFFILARPGSPLYHQLVLSSDGIREFRYYQLISAGFLHAHFGHIFFNMWGLWIFGRLVAPYIGGARFLALYLAGVLAGNGLFLAFNWGGHTSLLGASGAVCAIMMAAAMLEPNRQFVMIFMPFFPLKTSTLVICYTILEMLSEMSGAEDNVAHLAHLGGFAGGYIFLKAIYGKRFLPWDPFRRRPRPGEWLGKSTTAQRDPDPEPRQTPGGRSVSQRELDALLDKISREGINSLTAAELARLKQAREEMRGGR